MRRRTVLLAGVLLAALVGPAGTAPAVAAAPTPLQVRTIVRDAIAASRTKADSGVRVVGTMFGVTTTYRYDGTSHRIVSRGSDGVDSLVAPTAAYYRRKDPTETGAKVLAGKNAATWVRYTNKQEGWAFPSTLLDELFAVQLETDDPVAATVTPKPDGRTVYELTWEGTYPRFSMAYTVDARGLLVRRDTATEGFPVLTYTYGAQRVTEPKNTMPVVTYDKARHAYTLPARMRAALVFVTSQLNTGSTPTVATIRTRSRAWRDSWNSSHAAKMHVRNVKGGARIWTVQRFSRRTIAHRIVLVKGRAVLR